MAMCMRDETEARSTRRSQFAASHSAAAPSGPLSSATGSLCLSMGSDLRPARRPACSKQQRSPSINTVQESAHKEADGAFSATATPRRQRARSRGKGRTAETSTTPPAPPDRSVSAYRCNLPAAAPCRLHARNYSLQLFLLACKRGPKATPSKPPKYAAPSKETEGNRQIRGSFCELPAYAMLSTAPTFMGADDAAGFVTVFIATPSTGSETERATAMMLKMKERTANANPQLISK